MKELPKTKISGFRCTCKSTFGIMWAKTEFHAFKQFVQKCGMYNNQSLIIEEYKGERL